MEGGGDVNDDIVPCGGIIEVFSGFRASKKGCLKSPTLNSFSDAVTRRLYQVKLTHIFRK
jgi:hypothetical protein